MQHSWGVGRTPLFWTASAHYSNGTESESLLYPLISCSQSLIYLRVAARLGSKVWKKNIENIKFI